MSKIKAFFTSDYMVVIYTVAILWLIGFGSTKLFNTKPKQLSKTYMLYYMNGEKEKFVYKYDENVLDFHAKLYLKNGCVMTYYNANSKDGKAYRCQVKKIKLINYVR